MRIRCKCGQKYNIKDELAGQYVRCRKCGENVLVQSHDQPMAAQPMPASPAPVAPTVQRPPAAPKVEPTFEQGLADDDPNYLGELTDHQMSMGPAYDVMATQPSNFPTRPGPRKPIRKHAKLDFKYVNLGLKLIFAGITMGLACSLFATLFTYGQVPAVAGLLLFGAFVGHLLSMVGYVFCIWVPAQTESRPLIIAANVCNGVNVIVSLAAALVTASSPSAGTPLFDFISFLVGVATIILFLIFLKKVSLFVGDTNAAENAWSLLIFYVAVGGIAALFMLSLLFVVPALPTKMRFVYVIIGILTIVIVAFIWLLHFLKFIDDLEFRKDTRRR